MSHSSNAPRNQSPSGKITRRLFASTMVAAFGTLFTGCRFMGAPCDPATVCLPGGSHLENPLFIPVTDSEFLWNEVVDELDDYFKIRREERVRVIDNVVTEGWIETFPTVGSSILEPWRRDAIAGFERWHSTLQSTRRWARVRVIPAEGGHQVEVNVFKELEDIEQPEYASVGGATQRYDNSRERDDDSIAAGTGSLGWIPQGRDVQLEQRILGNLLERFKRR